ncbi:MAG TPA: NAD(P)H-quinone oxidoreductase [Thermoanaerobaculia bacterium]
MRAIHPYEPGSPDPRLSDLPEPAPGPGEVLVAVRAAGLNHADLHQLRGAYPPPPGESLIPGLECAGTVLALGEGVEGAERDALFAPGARVMALVAGGAHAERAAIPVDQLMPIPQSLSFVEAAAVPEAGLTAWTNLVVEGGLEAGESVLVTGATGGMGTMFVQLAKELGARVIAAARSRERLEGLRALGADEVALLDDELPARVRAATGGRGADLVIELAGGAGINRRLAALAVRGRLVLVGLLAGRRAEIDLDVVLARRLRVQGSVLRARSRAEKSALVAAFAAFALPRFASGRLRPVVDRALPFERAPEAYAALARGGVGGKIVLEL